MKKKIFIITCLAVMISAWAAADRDGGNTKMAKPGIKQQSECLSYTGSGDVH